MKLCLGSRVIKISRVSKITQVSPNTAKITFVTGELIQVACGVQYPHRSLICYPGTYEELASLLQRLKA